MKQAALTLLLAFTLRAEDSSREHGPWKLGMSREELQAAREYGPYRAVRVTGGIETANGMFDGEKCNVAFVFSPEGRLNKIQIWAYEGRSEAEALAAWWRVYRYYSKAFGRVESPVLGMPLEVDQASLTERTRTAFGSVPGHLAAKIQMAPAEMPANAKVFASLGRAPLGVYYLFVNIMEP